MPYGLLSLEAGATEWHGEVEILAEPGISTSASFESSDELAHHFARLVDGEKYQAVGLSTMCSSFHHSLGIAVGIKRRYPKLKMWLGGPHASVAPASILEGFPEVDAVFVGEAEATFRDLFTRGDELTDAVIGAVPGVYTRLSPFVRREPMSDLDDLPFIDRAADYVASCASSVEFTSRGIPIEAERGCPGRCTFCSTRLFWGSRVRRKSDRRLIAEMRRLHFLTGKRLFSLIGDNMAAPAWRLLAFCESMQTEAPDYRWTCSLTIDRLRAQDLDVLWAGGCRGMFVGLESGSQDTLDRVRKGIDLSRSVRLLHEAIERGFSVDTSFIVGFPWETSSDLKKTYKLHLELLERGVNKSQVVTLCPLPGTDLQRSEGDSIQAGEGESKAAADDLPYGVEAVALMQRCPELFTQFGCFETRNIGVVELRATVDAASMANAYYQQSKKELILD